MPLRVATGQHCILVCILERYTKDSGNILKNMILKPLLRNLCFHIHFYMYCNSRRTVKIQCVKHTQKATDQVAVNLYYSFTDKGKKGLG